MKKILFINACVRPESRTYILAKQVLSKLEGELEEVKLEHSDLIPLNLERLQKRDALVQKNDFSDPIFQYARQFIEADEIVIAAPYWDLSFPSMVKIYFEAVTVCGLSFKYTAEGYPKGLCKAKRIIYVTTAGGPIAQCNLGFDYVKALSQAFFEIPEILCFKAENLDIVGADVEEIMKTAISEIEHHQKL